MKKLFLIPIFLALLIGCFTEKRTLDETISAYYIEQALSFFDPYELTYSNGKYQGYTYETWIRQPENLRMVHETLKKIGYNKLISGNELNAKPCLIWGYVKRPLRDIIDSLIITYPLDTIQVKYYREFWERRKKEANQEVVFEILTELSQSLLQNQTVKYNEEKVNDTLYHLIIIDRLRENPTSQQALQDFNYLKQIGMHGSAYNLLYETSSYQQIPWDKAELASELKMEKGNCCQVTWIQDDTK